MQGRKNWILADAQTFLQQIQPVLSSLEVSAQIVGSVATAGVSNNDLDVVLNPTRPMSLDEIIEGVEAKLLRHISKDKTVNPMESGCRENTWFLPVVLFDGRLVEFYLPESVFPMEQD